MRTFLAGLLLAIWSAIALAQSDAELAKRLINPFSTLIRVPVELDYDRRIGPANGGKAWSLAVQPLIPFALEGDWDIISRTILQFTAQQEVFPGAGRQTGLGDTLQSFFFSPRHESREDISWGVGPAFLLPTATNDMLGAKKWGVGPTGGVFHDSGPWTVGILANHLWSVAGSGATPISSTFLQPQLSYTTDSAWSYTLQTEATYDWKGRQWSVPLEASVAKLVRIGGEQVNFELGAHRWAASTDSGPKGWGWSFTTTFLFPDRWAKR